MTVFVGLLRAINVGGTGSLSMADLRRLCEEAGFSEVQTYIQSGNVVFASKLSEAKAKAKLEQVLAAHMKKPVGVVLRTGPELAAVVKKTPFPDAAPNQVLVFFMDEAPAKSVLSDLSIPGREEVRLVGREVIVHYPDGQGRSKLKLPFAKTATGRNLNTVAKLAGLAGA